MENENHANSCTPTFRALGHGLASDFLCGAHLTYSGTSY